MEEESVCDLCVLARVCLSVRMCVHTCECEVGFAYHLLVGFLGRQGFVFGLKLSLHVVSPPQHGLKLTRAAFYSHVFTKQIWY